MGLLSGYENTFRIKVQLKANFFDRSSLREKLLETKENIETQFPNARCWIEEKKLILSSFFEFSATCVPARAEADFRRWAKHLKEIYS